MFIVLVFVLSSHDIPRSIFYGILISRLQERCSFMRVYSFHVRNMLVQKMCMGHCLFWIIEEWVGWARLCTLLTCTFSLQSMLIVSWGSRDSDAPITGWTCLSIHFISLNYCSHSSYLKFLLMIDFYKHVESSQFLTYRLVLEFFSCQSKKYLILLNNLELFLHFIWP